MRPLEPSHTATAPDGPRVASHDSSQRSTYETFTGKGVGSAASTVSVPPNVSRTIVSPSERNTTNRPSGLMSTGLPGVAPSGRRSSSCERFHTRTLPLLSAEVRCRPSGVTASAVTALSPRNLCLRHQLALAIGSRGASSVPSSNPSTTASAVRGNAIAEALISRPDNLVSGQVQSNDQTCTVPPADATAISPAKVLTSARTSVSEHSHRATHVAVSMHHTSSIPAGRPSTTCRPSAVSRNRRISPRVTVSTSSPPLRRPRRGPNRCFGRRAARPSSSVQPSRPPTGRPA